MSTRSERRRQVREQRKSSAKATDDEIFPGKHGPVQSEAAAQMNVLAEVIQETLGPNYFITLFVAEKVATGGREAPRFNYISTANRADMYAVIRAWLKKNEGLADVLHKFEDATPPEGKPS